MYVLWPAGVTRSCRMRSLAAADTLTRLKKPQLAAIQINDRNYMRHWHSCARHAHAPICTFSGHSKSSAPLWLAAMAYAQHMCLIHIHSRIVACALFPCERYVTPRLAASVFVRSIGANKKIYKAKIAEIKKIKRAKNRKVNEKFIKIVKKQCRKNHMPARCVISAHAQKY